jgi:hypothetical protein
LPIRGISVACEPSRSVELIIGSSALRGPSPNRFTFGADAPGVLGGGVVSMACELVLEGEDRAGFDLEGRKC